MRMEELSQAAYRRYRQVVYEDREFQTIDEDEVLAQANRAFREVIERMEVPDLESVRRS